MVSIIKQIAQTISPTSDVVLETAVYHLGLETTRDRFLAVLVLVLALPVLVLDLVSKDWSRVFFLTSHVAKMPTGASSRTAAEHILSAHLTATS